MLGWLNAVRRRPILLLLSLLLLVAAMLVLGLALRSLGQRLSDPRNLAFLNWAQADSESRVELITVQREPCPGAPFILPADGFIGLLYGDPRGPYSQSRPHQGIDIFSDTDPGVTPVYAAYDGYVTRESGWRSSLIMRVPEDPLDEERQIWLYYTHMADRQGNDFIEPQFSPGTRELFVERGTLLGYTGNYNGSSARGVWVHLHFSIVQDNGSGGYLNELEFENSLDPSPYLGMNVGYECQAGSPDCGTTPECVAP
jgi:murein DD-endopeptidase MepM/ murein hydrolase activator NlpD